MEAVIGSIPIRSTNHLKTLAIPAKSLAHILQELSRSGTAIFPSSLAEPVFGSMAELRAGLKIRHRLRVPPHSDQT
jgi:hypothetical protein